MKDGIYTDLSIIDYHKNDTHISSSSVKKAKKSLKDFWHYLHSEKERKSHFDFGNVFELALLEPLEITRKVAVFDHTKRPFPENNFNKKENKEWKEKWIRDNKDKYQINQHDTKQESYDQVVEMVSSCKANAVINKAIQNVDYQYSIFWTDEETGLKLKTRPDVIKLKKNVIIDIKTCKDASPHGFSYDACKLDYPIQAIMQIMGVVKSGLMDSVDAYFWLAVQKTAPFHAELYEFEKDDQESIHAVYRHVLRKIAQARKENKYPGFSDRSLNDYGVLPLSIPPYYINEII